MTLSVTWRKEVTCLSGFSYWCWHVWSVPVSHCGCVYREDLHVLCCPINISMLLNHLCVQFFDCLNGLSYISWYLLFDLQNISKIFRPFARKESIIKMGSLILLIFCMFLTWWKNSSLCSDQHLVVQKLLYCNFLIKRLHDMLVEKSMH